MDVNGAKFMLAGGPRGWSDAEVRVTSATSIPVGGPTLALPELPNIFIAAHRTTPFTQADRSGAARSAAGRWYWIDRDHRRILWSNGRAAPSLYWDGLCPPDQHTAGEFSPTSAPNPPPFELRGLTITKGQRLVVGEMTRKVFVVFDLRSGSPPVVITMADIGLPTLNPFDLAPAPDGGLWVLDPTARTCWHLDRALRVCGSTRAPAAAPDGWTPSLTPDPPVLNSAARIAGAGHPLPTGGSLMAIEVDRLGRVIVLEIQDTPNPTSKLHVLKHASIPAWSTTELTLPDGSPIPPSHLGYDIAILDAQPAKISLVMAAITGNQAFRFDLLPDQIAPKAPMSLEYRPMHSFSGRGLVSTPSGHHFDVPDANGRADQSTRWTPLAPHPRRVFDREATFLLGQTHTDPPGAPRAFDSGIHACVWHRAFLDAEIPNDTAILLWARAADDLDQLSSSPWSPQPDLYLRSACELAFARPMADHADCDRTGTWEVLLHQAIGRFLQIQIKLIGNSRRTPIVAAARFLYPRVNYADRYLPAVYREHAEPGSFLERMLANFEGVLTDVEERIRHSDLLYDARATPTETLDWLAGWMGLALDPAWASLNEIHGRTAGSIDRRRLLVRMARRLYERRGTAGGLLLALELVIEPDLEARLERVREIARDATPNVPLVRERLRRMGLAPPMPDWTDEDFEDLLGELLMRHGSRRVRIVEAFKTRSLAPASASGPTAAPSTPDFAHRFSVLVRHGMSPDQERLVRRIIDLERPAHTVFELRRYWDMFTVGAARLGIDSVLQLEDEEPGFEQARLDVTEAGRSLLAAPPPMDACDRFIVDRDTPGNRRPI